MAIQSQPQGSGTENKGDEQMRVRQLCLLPFSPAVLGERGRAPAGTEKGGSISISAAYLLWVLELQRSRMLMPGLLFKVTGPLAQSQVGCGKSIKGISIVF